MKRYSVLFADADNTLFDFSQAERTALCKAMTAIGFHADDALAKEYSLINDRLWKALELGLTTQSELRVKRFTLLLEHMGASYDPAALSYLYTDELAKCANLICGAYSTLECLSKRVPIYIVTNGISDVQRGRLACSTIKPFITDIIISEEIGISKPDPHFFTIALERAGNPAPAEVLVVGDSLSSDILGANRAQIDSCWFNPDQLHNNTLSKPTYEIRALSELDALLR